MSVIILRKSLRCFLYKLHIAFYIIDLGEDVQRSYRYIVAVAEFRVPYSVQLPLIFELLLMRANK